jgi:hypothetical protein
MSQFLKTMGLNPIMHNKSYRFIIRIRAAGKKQDRYLREISIIPNHKAINHETNPYPPTTNPAIAASGCYASF